MPDVTITQPVGSDIYEWVIIYRDGTHLREHGGGDAPCLAATPHGPEIAHGGACVRLDQSVQGFYLQPLRDGLPFVALSVPKGARPIIFRRRHVFDVLRNKTGQADLAESLTVVGWQRIVRGESVKYLLAVAPDGSVMAAEDESLLSSPGER